jgi:hypothetical protein
MKSNKPRKPGKKDPDCGCEINPIRTKFQSGVIGTDFYNFPVFAYKEVPLWFQATGPNSIALGKNIFFPKDSDLDNSITTAVEVLTASDQTSYVGTGVAFDLLSQTVHSRITLYLKERGTDDFYIKDLPLPMLSRTVRRGKPFQCRMNLDIGQSFITINNTTGLIAGRALLFHFYTEPATNGK